MNDPQVILSALNDYTGTLDSLHDFTAVVQQEIGPDWVNSVYEVMKDLGPVDKERLDHAVSYHCAVLSWDEINGYLTQPTLTPEIADRLPVMEHWLKFFGDEGLAVVKELRQKLADAGISTDKNDDISVTETVEAPQDSTADTADENTADSTDMDDTPKADDTPEADIAADRENPFEQEETEIVSSTQGADDTSPVETTTEPEQIAPSFQGDLTAWLQNKIFKEIALLDTTQEWIAARCHQLGGLEINEYSYHGFLDDLKRLVAQDIQEVLLHQEGYPLLKSVRADAIEYLTTYRENLEKELATDDMPTPLTKEQLTKEEMQRTLGGIDTQTTQEYLGPAPDGFEVVDDNSADVQAYQKMEQEIEAKSTADELTPDRTLEKKDTKTSEGLRGLFSKIPPTDTGAAS